MAPKVKSPINVPAPPVGDAPADHQFYPKAKYCKDDKAANGYRALRVEDEEAEARLGPQWKDSPADV